MSDYPLSGYHFQVDWGGTRIGFAEVSGLEVELQVIEYRDGSDPEYRPRKMPGQARYSNIVLKRGILPGDNEFFEWLNTARLHTIERRDLTIHLLNENHEPVMSWRARNAFPVKLSGPVLNAARSEVAIERLEIAHEGLAVQTGK